MTTDLKMDYNAVHDMATAFRKAGSQLSEIEQGIHGSVATLNQGALVGLHGDRLADAFQKNLANTFNAAIAKCEDMARQLELAITELQQDDGTAGSLFSDHS